LISATGQIPDGPISVRAHQVIKNLQGIITAVGSSFDDVLKTTVFLTNIGDFQEVNAVYAEYFKPPYPARSAIQVAALPLATDIEIEAVVFVK
jgi:2-iminobutanoate/2-iminopropanoate deaminase